MSGFLYQMLGCAAVCAAACQDPRTVGSEFEALVSLARGKEVYQEMYGQDMALKPLLDATDQGTVLVQFKYSRDGIGKAVLPSELKTIAKQLAEAAKRVETEGGQVFCCYLVTNRQLGPGAVELLTPAASVSGLSKAVRDMFGKLRAVEQISASKWIQTLKAFAARYGSFPREIDEGVGKIVARMFQQGAGPLSGPPLRLADLVEAFTGNGDANPLVRAGMGEQMQRELRPLAPEKCGKLVRREILDRIVRETPDRALIVFAGRGGMGKTASLHAWADELSEIASGPVCPLVAATTTRDLPEDWPDRLLAKWRNLHASGREKIGFDRVVERLKIANSDLKPPMLHVSLDGLDEHADDSSLKKTVGRVVRWFLEQDRICRETRSLPTARLVVTCRSESQFSKDWLYGSSGFPGDEEDSPPTFLFDRFTDSEFAAVVRDNLPSSLHGRLLTLGATAPMPPDDDTIPRG